MSLYFDCQTVQACSSLDFADEDGMHFDKSAWSAKRSSVMRKAKIIILEGTWWKKHEQPLVLQYFNALAISYKEIDVSHRTIRNAEDIDYYISKISPSQRVMLYFACHGSDMNLMPSGNKSKIEFERLLESFSKAKSGAISFIHFGCCEMSKTGDRRVYERIMELTKAEWVSGYGKEVDWLASTLLDLAVVMEFFVPRNLEEDRRKAPYDCLEKRFNEMYGNLARKLEFSAVWNTSNGNILLPKHLHRAK